MTRKQKNPNPKDEINRIKAVLAERGVSQSWLAEQLDYSAVAVFSICKNETQPPLWVLKRIAQLLDCDIRDLLVPTKRFPPDEKTPMPSDGKSVQKIPTTKSDEEKINEFLDELRRVPVIYRADIKRNINIKYEGYKPTWDTGGTAAPIINRINSELSLKARKELFKRFKVRN